MLLTSVILSAIVARADLYAEEVVESLPAVLRIYSLPTVILFGVSDCDRYLLQFTHSFYHVDSIGLESVDNSFQLVLVGCLIRIDIYPDL